jgi:hypothetical protein
VGSEQWYGDCGWLVAIENRWRQREIEPQDGYRGRREVAPDQCRSRFGEAEMQPGNFSAR